MATDTYSTYSSGPSSLGRKGRVITPGATDIDPIAKSVTALTDGDVTVVPVDNADVDTLAFVGVSPGWICPYQVRRVTAATAVVATIED